MRQGQTWRRGGSGVLRSFLLQLGRSAVLVWTRSDGWRETVGVGEYELWLGLGGPLHVFAVSECRAAQIRNRDSVQKSACEMTWFCCPCLTRPSIATYPYICLPIDIHYAPVFVLPQPPPPSHPVRDEIAGCSERAYESLSSADAAALLMFSSPDDLKAYADKVCSSFGRCKLTEQLLMPVAGCQFIWCSHWVC